MSLGKALPVVALALAAVLTPTVTQAAGAPAAAASTSSAPPSAASGGTTTAPPPRTVEPGQVVDLGHGVRMKLSDQQMCVYNDGYWNCETIRTRYHGRFSAMGSAYTTTAMLHFSRFDSPTLPARMTSTYRGVSYQLPLLRVPGKDGYTVGYLWQEGCGQPYPMHLRFRDGKYTYVGGMSRYYKPCMSGGPMIKAYAADGTFLGLG